MTRQIIKNIISDEERALYNTQNAKILNCTFVGEKDGESALKESRDIQIKNTHFCLRYPLWHVQKFSVETSIFTDTCRAPIWYSTSVKIVNTEISGVKLCFVIGQLLKHQIPFGGNFSRIKTLGFL